MADINALPKEILDHVISFMDDSTQLTSRLASTQWFKQIRYSDFLLTKIRDEHLEAVATRLSQYDRPISITFPYSPRRRLGNIIGALTKLTNVESLNLGLIDNLSDEEDWLKMTCLTNLKYLSADGAIPKALYLHMTWLRNFSDNGLVPLSDAKQIFQSLKDLDSVYYYPDDGAVDAFELVKSLSRLSSLTLAHPEWETANEENTKALANLKVLNWGNYYTTTTDGNQMSLRHMTSLEDLRMTGPFQSLTSIHLTRIVVSGNAIESLVQSYSKLHNLKILDVRFEGLQVESFNAALESFTALEELYLSNCPNEAYCSIYNFVKSTNLTYLELRQWLPTVPITLTTLTALMLSVDDPVDCSVFSHLVNLTTLNTYSDTMRGTFSSSITKLRELTWTDTHQVQLDLSLLPDLEYLDIAISESNALKGLERATNLKSLIVNSPSNTVVDFKFLSSLTLLQHLGITYVICQNLWPQLRGLTNLRTLAVPRMEREDQLLYLTNMVKLREFTTMAQYVAGIHLTRLTSLQSLSFKSDMAARSIAVNSLYKALTRLVTHNF